MKDDIKNLKRIINSDLENIHVNDELKSMTIKKCKENNKITYKALPLIAACTAVLIIGLTTYKYLSHTIVNPLKVEKQISNNNSNINKYKDNSKNINQGTNFSNSTNSTNQKSSKSTTVDDKDSNSSTKVSNDNANSNSHKSYEENKTLNNTKPSNNSNTIAPSTSTTETSNFTQGTQNPNETVQDNINIAENHITPSVKNSPDILAKSPDNSISNYDNSKSTLTAPINTLDAEKYWGGKISFPTYIPEGFELTDIFIPPNNTKEKYIRLTYSYKNSYFRILENKSTTYSSIGKAIDINGITAYLTENKDENNADSMIIQVDWVRNNIQYSIFGNISEDSIINVVKSIK